MEALAKLSVVERDAELKSILKSLGALRRGEAGVTLPTEWEGVQRSQQAGFDHYVVKPADVDILLSIVSQPLAKRLAAGGP